MDNKTQNIFDVISNDSQLIDAIKNAYTQTVTETGDSSYTRFMNAVKHVANSHVKPNVSTSRASSSGSNSWKDDIKSEFTGRGRQWFYVSLDDINPILDKFDSDGFDTSSYRNDINNAGKAWVRFANVSGTESSPQLKVEVRIDGSKIDHPRNRVNMPYKSDIERLEDGKTPFALGLESGTKKDNSASTDVQAVKVEDVVETQSNSQTLIDNDDENLKAFVDDVKAELENEVLRCDDDDDSLMSHDEMEEIFG
jgi:hypothetical protein